MGDRSEIKDKDGYKVGKLVTDRNTGVLGWYRLGGPRSSGGFFPPWRGNRGMEWHGEGQGPGYTLRVKFWCGWTFKFPPRGRQG